MRDRDLVRLYWPVELRAAFDALFALDDALGDVVGSTSQPAVGAIRLAWWREALERLDRSPPPPEPRLQGAAAHLLPRGLSGSSLAGLEDGWAALLDETIDRARVERRGALLFALAAQLLEGDHPLLARAGGLYALGQVARRSGDRGPPTTSGLRSVRFPARLRALTGLARLAARDPREPEATPGRAAALLLHRATGRIA